MDLKELKKEIIYYQNDILNYIDVLLNYKPIKKAIKGSNETFYGSDPSIQIYTEDDEYKIYIQLSVDKQYFGLWCRDEFEKSPDCTDGNPSLLIDYIHNNENIYEALHDKFKELMPDMIADKFLKLTISLDPYSIHIEVDITDEDMHDQPELPGMSELDARSRSDTSSVSVDVVGVVGDIESPYMTLLEYTKLIAERAKLMEQYNDKGPTINVSTLPTKDQIDPIKIAIEELRQGQFMLDLVRVLPNGKEFIMNPNEMILPK